MIDYEARLNEVGTLTLLEDGYSFEHGVLGETFTSDLPEYFTNIVAGDENTLEDIYNKVFGVY